MGAAAEAHAFEPRWTVGLDVSTERMVGQTGVNGILFRVERATGHGVPELAQRMRIDWQREQGEIPVLASSESGWSLLGRISRGESEVVQWRGVGDEAELIWSITDLRERNDVPLGKVPRPRNCSWMPPVHGQVLGQWFLQVSGYCPGTSSALSAELRRLLSGSKWVEVRPAHGQILQVLRGDRRAQIAITPVSGHSPAAATNVVILELGVNSVHSQ
jgi:hypothetical protein